MRVLSAAGSGRVPRPWQSLVAPWPRSSPQPHSWPPAAPRTPRGGRCEHPFFARCLRHLPLCGRGGASWLPVEGHATVPTVVPLTLWGWGRLTWELLGRLMAAWRGGHRGSSLCPLGCRWRRGHRIFCGARLCLIVSSLAWLPLSCPLAAVSRRLSCPRSWCSGLPASVAPSQKYTRQKEPVQLARCLIKVLGSLASHPFSSAPSLVRCWRWCPGFGLSYAGGMKECICSIFPKVEVIISFFTRKSPPFWSLSLQVESVDSALIFSAWLASYLKFFFEKSVFSRLPHDDASKQLAIPISTRISGLCFHWAVSLCACSVLFKCRVTVVFIMHSIWDRQPP